MKFINLITDYRYYSLNINFTNYFEDENLFWGDLPN